MQVYSADLPKFARLVAFLMLCRPSAGTAMPITEDPLAAWRNGGAAGYSAYLFSDLNYSFSDTQEGIFVGGNARLQDYRIGDRDPANLVVQGTLTFKRGYVTGSIYNDNPSLDQVGVGGDVLTLSELPAPAIPAGPDYYRTLSQDWAAGDPVGNLYQTSWRAFRLDTVPGINVFTLNTQTTPLTLYNRFDIYLDRNAKVIINILGDSLELHNLGFYLNNALVDEYLDPGAYLAQNIFFNFPEARTLTLGCVTPGSNTSCGGIGLPGHLLAPWADITAINGQLIGALVANSLSDGNLPASNGRFQINRIPIPSPGTLTLLLAGVLMLFAARLYPRH